MKKPPASPLVHKLKMRKKRRLQEQRGTRRSALWSLVTQDERFEPTKLGVFARRFLKRGSRAPQ
jgi:hypothetical protein